ncbi:MAG: bifunctional nuclease family protein [candidate division WOR-3 bacterium]
MIEVKVAGVKFDEKSRSPVVFLKEASGNRVLPIFIGPAEATAIMYALENVNFERPLTLDLMKRLIEGLGGKIQRVVITEIRNNTFFAEIILEKEGNKIVIDARPSDSVGLALKINCPIYCEESVMENCGILIPETPEDPIKEIEDWLRKTEPEDLGDFQI